jgi:uncharacterized SAM-binding protein YcdF (DUF218 family)
VRRLLLSILALPGLAVAVLLLTGFVLDPPRQAPLPPSDAIVVISGDEQLARFREGLRLYRLGLGRYLVFSGAADDAASRSNADVMRDLAIQQGVSPNSILEEPQGQDTWGNAVYTRPLLEARGLTSVILVTSPYHLRRAQLTFEAAFKDSGIQVVAHAAPDSQWRKLSWWQEPETRRLTRSELEKLLYIFLTGRYHSPQ